MLQIYNTLTRQKEKFEPLDPKNVRMYVCGMTVYDYCHLGHARVLVVFDMIARWLRQHGYPLTYVRNITDIDDKIIKRANERGITIQELTEEFITAMNEDSDKLGVLRPDVEPKATEHIPQMIQMIEDLIANGKAYPAANGDVYYAVREFAAYGQLSGKSLDDLRAGERVDVDTNKRDPLDFVLWKAAKPEEPHWNSPWGKVAQVGTLNVQQWAANCLGRRLIFTAAARICNSHITKMKSRKAAAHTIQAAITIMATKSFKAMLNIGCITVLFAWTMKKCLNRWAIFSQSAMC